MISTSFPTLSSWSPSIASPRRKRRASCSWCLILNFFKAGSTEVFSHRDSRFSLRYAPSGHSKALNQRRKSDFGTVFVLPGPKIGKTTPHRPHDVCLPSGQVQKAAGQVEAADGFQYSWPLTRDSNRYQLSVSYQSVVISRVPLFWETSVWRTSS